MRWAYDPALRRRRLRRDRLEKVVFEYFELEN